MKKEVNDKGGGSRGKGVSGMGKPLKDKAGRLIATIISFILIFALYVFIIRSQSELALVLYKAFYIVFVILLVATIVLNGGFSKDIPEPSQLRDSWTDEQKSKFIRLLTVGKKWAKRLMVVLLPMMAVIIFDIAYLFWFSS